MANFATFVEKTQAADSTVVSGDYVVGYTASTPSEFRISIKNLFSKINDFLEDQTISSEKVYFLASGGAKYSIDDKLNFLRSLEDYGTNNITTAVNQNKASRLFIGNKTVEVFVKGPKSQFDTIQAAIAAIKFWVVDANSIIRIVLAGNVLITTPIDLSIPGIANLELVGRIDNQPTAAIISIDSSLSDYNDSVLSCRNGCSVSIQNITIIGENTSQGTDTSVGILAENGGVITLRSKVVIYSNHYGILAQNGGVVNLSKDSLSLEEFPSINYCHIGLAAFYGGKINLPGCKSVSNFLYGVYADFGGNINCTNSRILGNAVNGIRCAGNSFVLCRGAQISDTANGAGVYVMSDGVVDCANEGINVTSSSNNHTYGYEVRGGTIRGESTLGGSGNTTDLTNSFAVLTTYKNSSDQEQAHVKSLNGPLIVGTTDENDIQFKTNISSYANNNPQFKILNPGSPVNYITVAAGVANNTAAKIDVEGSETNPNLQISTKGSGYVILGDGNTSNVQFGTFATGIINSDNYSVAGYITIKDKDGKPTRIQAYQNT